MLFWEFTTERQWMFWRKLRGETPLTTDPVLARSCFTNVYRVLDRMSQFVVGIARRGPDPDTSLRLLLFRAFCRPGTYQLIEHACGGNIACDTYDPGLCVRLLSRADRMGVPLFRISYQLCMSARGYRDRPFENFLRWAGHMRDRGVCAYLAQARSTRELYDALVRQPMMGEFYAWQHAVDQSYMRGVRDEWAVLGPGAKKGLALTPYKTLEELIAAKPVGFPGVPGLAFTHIDAEHALCEYYKHSRGGSKNRPYRSSERLARYEFPEAWNVPALDGGAESPG